MKNTTMKGGKELQRMSMYGIINIITFLLKRKKGFRIT